MTIEIKVPSVGESVTEALLAEWFKQDGDSVEKNEPLFVIETDKVTLEVEAEAAGQLKILVGEGETVAIGIVVGEIDTAVAGDTAPKAAKEPEAEAKPPEPEAEAQPPEAAKEKAPAEPAKDTPPPEADKEAAAPEAQQLSPAVRRLVAENNLDPAKVSGTGPGGRVTKGDVLLYLEGRPAEEARAAASVPAESGEGERRQAMSPIRRRIAERLLAAKQNTAMLTTFNEIDMSQAMAMRAAYKEAFQKKHGIGLGFMSFFVKACVEALGEIPEINAFVDGKDFVYHDHCHIGIAVGAPKGLVVPVLRHAEKMSFADVEQAIGDYVAKIKDNRLELADLEGGTFTISNGGVYGSLLSTPILNMPQSGILGMHKIEKRPVVVDDEIVIRPMMYVALSYDHRIVDGKGAVTFLRRVKEFVENPERILLEV
ncbi:MAG: 2-oxoglutarate dehydrogenase complex dihydrolipoyllysine-residue succinyltransferase [Desulfobacteraceae bacterium]|nr:2-oxoglutarate dehydrogenase complex dihydrolipoyllysine-residue succinyltransferase [Desulfobacteraceae bacterium]MBC2753869.1 2-oxoglutarate dehydrogenase complex dihydrolipoyllysine-residue succinyltransferase [Desulfobacteraceae bacterium]